MLIQNITRKFIVTVNNEPITLPDPNSEYSIDQVMSMYSNAYPELVNATYKELPIKDNVVTYEFLTTLGTKG